MANTLETALENVLLTWESEEQSVEEKLDQLERYIFDSAGLKYDDEYYAKKGKFLHRYAAGFIHKYIQMMKDTSFILLDPLHIIDILSAFVKGIFTHPIKTLRSIWDTWTYYFTTGAFGLGMMSADALLVGVIATAVAFLGGGAIAGAFGEAAATTSDVVVSNITDIPSKFIGIAKGAKSTVGSIGKMFKSAISSPTTLLKDAEVTLQTGEAVGQMIEFKYYAEPFMKQHA